MFNHLLRRSPPRPGGGSSLKFQQLPTYRFLAGTVHRRQGRVKPSTHTTEIGISASLTKLNPSVEFLRAQAASQY